MMRIDDESLCGDEEMVIELMMRFRVTKGCVY